MLVITGTIMMVSIVDSLVISLMVNRDVIVIVNDVVIDII